MKKLNTKGFGAIEVFLILVVVAIIAGAGYMVYNSQKKTNTALDNAAKSQVDPQKSEKKEDVKPEDNEPNEDHIAIKQWGVKIPISSEDNGFYYEIDSAIEQSSSDPTNLTVYSKETDSIVGKSGVSCKGEYVAYIIRLPANDSRWQPSQNVDDGNVSPLYGSRTIVGDYQYAVATKKSYGPTCLATSSTGDYQADQIAIQKFQIVVEAFTRDFKNIYAQ